MKCPLCSSEIHEAVTKINRRVNGRKIKIENTPCFQCENNDCGEIMIHALSIKKIKKLIRQIRQNETEVTETYNYNDIKIKG